jgi:hypothetical protein
MDRIHSFGRAPSEQIVGVRNRVLRAVEEAGRDSSEVTCAYNVAVTIADQIESSEGELIGPLEYLGERLSALNDLGSLRSTS